MVLDARVQYIFLYNFLLLLTLGVFLSYIGRTGRYVPRSYESKRYTVFLLLFMNASLSALEIICCHFQCLFQLG